MVRLPAMLVKECSVRYTLTSSHPRIPLMRPFGADWWKWDGEHATSQSFRRTARLKQMLNHWGQGLFPRRTLASNCWQLPPDGDELFALESRGSEQLPKAFFDHLIDQIFDVTGIEPAHLPGAFRRHRQGDLATIR